MTRILILLFLFTSNSFAAGIQKWTDEQGNISYGDSPPAKAQTEPVNISRPPSNPGKPLPRLTTGEKNTAKVQDKTVSKPTNATSTQQDKLNICEKARKDLNVISANNVIRMRNTDGSERILSDAEVDQRRTKLEQDIKQYCK